MTLSPSSVFVLLGCLASLPPPASHALNPLAQYCCALSGRHPSLALRLAPYCLVPVAGTLTAEWLSSPGGSPCPLHPPRDFFYGRNWLVGYARSCYSTTSLAYAKVQSPPICGQPARVNALPYSHFGWRNSVQASGNSSFSSPFVPHLCCLNPFFCFGGPAEGFVSFPGFISILVFPYVSGGRYCTVLLSS